MGDLGEVEVCGIRPENWAEAERTVDEIIRELLPNSASEVKRSKVVGYVQRLIKDRVGAEVLPYGSVPLKTYLPEGDIDLTVFGGRNIEENMADDMKAVLEEEERKTDSEFVVKDVQLIRAEVKIVKCIIQNIVVDISLNQLGGLSTLCFLEQVDRVIGGDHLFKRSIILIKAWCYYESRILGAHHGLIATYALEVLVLYIFHVFHSKITGPLSVLYKFLEYFSKFDWENYCITLNGPVRLSSLPLFVAEMPEDRDENLLLSDEFLSSCVRKYSVPSREGEKNYRGFQSKHLNIVDPMKDSNNLGRSVSRGNFYRIRSALTYGARKLAQILLLPKDSVSDEIHRFFASTNPCNKGRQQPIPQFPEARTKDLSEEGCDELHGATKTAFKGLTLSHDPPANQNPTRQEGPTFKLPVFAPHLHFAKSNPNEDEFERISSRSDEEGRAMSNGPVEGKETVEKDGSLAVLAGDYETYLQHLQYGRRFFEGSIDGHSLRKNNPPPFPSIAGRPLGNQWNNHHRTPILRVEQNEAVSYMNGNGVYVDPSSLYPMQRMVMHNPSFRWEDLPKPRGTGTFLPNLIHPPQGYTPSSSMMRNRGPTVVPQHNNGIVMFASEADVYHGSNNEASQIQPHTNNRNGMVGPSGAFQSFPPQTNGYHAKPEASDSGKNRQHRKPDSSSPRKFPKENDDRGSSKSSSYQLKDEGDFPPL